jgi:hypothetical protein
MLDNIGIFEQMNDVLHMNDNMSGTYASATELWKLFLYVVLGGIRFFFFLTGYVA